MSSQKQSDSMANGNIGLFLVLASIFAVATSAALWLFDNSTTDLSAESQIDNASSLTKPSLANWSDRKLSAQKIREEALEDDERMRKKYDPIREKKHASNRQRSNRKQSTHRSWRDQKEQTENYYSRFRNDKTNRPNSVKVQLQNSINNLESDAPRRW